MSLRRNCSADRLTATGIGGKPASCQATGLTAGRAEHPFADWHDQPAFFGQRNETCRRCPHHAAEPAQQRLHADDAAARQIHLRLVVEREFLCSRAGAGRFPGAGVQRALTFMTSSKKR